MNGPIVEWAHFWLLEHRTDPEGRVSDPKGHASEKWIRFSLRGPPGPSRPMPLFKEKASDSPQKCKSTFGSDALERNDHLPKQHAQPAGWRIRLRPGSSAAKVRFRTAAVPAIVGAFRIARDAAARTRG
jgi:hypothetical protein